MSKPTDIGAPLDLDRRRAMYAAFSECLTHGDNMLPQEIADRLLAAAAPSPQSASVDAIGQDERALFEAWVKTRIGYPFAGTFLNFMWDAWQARAALAHRSVSPAPSVAASVSDAKIREIGALTYGFPIKSDDLEFAKEVLKEAAAASQAAPATCQPSGAIGQAPTAEPEGWRAFIENCSRCGGGMVNGNRLAIVAKELLGAAPADPSRAAIDPEARDE